MISAYALTLLRTVTGMENLSKMFLFSIINLLPHHFILTLIAEMFLMLTEGNITSIWIPSFL